MLNSVFINICSSFATIQIVFEVSKWPHYKSDSVDCSTAIHIIFSAGHQETMHNNHHLSYIT